jgi:ribosomal-protein-serine acetyltransferase
MTVDKIIALPVPVLTAHDSTVLQPAEPDDAERYLNLVEDNYKQLTKWLRVPKPPATVKDRRKAQATDLANYDGGKGYWWLIEEDGKLAGTIALHNVESTEKCALVGYWLDAAFTGKGIMTRSLKTVIDWAFSELGLNRVEIQASLNNTASIAIPERLGIKRESIRRQSEVINGVSLDMASYAAFADNWPSKVPSLALPSTEIRVDEEIFMRQHLASDYDLLWSAFVQSRDHLGEFFPSMAAYKTKDDYTRLYTTPRFVQDNFDSF